MSNYIADYSRLVLRTKLSAMDCLGTLPTLPTSPPFMTAVMEMESRAGVITRSRAHFQ
jgi:hypothetical protein